MLQADTFASGRLTNPSPPVWQNFTSVYILASPTYTAEYQIAQGLTLAIGQMITGLPWVGVLLSMGAMCAFTYWSLCAWLPPVWAFTGTLVVVDIQLGVLSYWMNSYWGGCVPALGGALALGGLLRLRDNKRRVRYSFVAAAGLLVVFNSRPLEGLLLSAVAAASLATWTFVSKQLSLQNLFRRVLPPFALGLVVAASLAGYYNFRVTGSPTKFPYLLYRSEYGMPQGFLWQKPVRASAMLPSDIQSEYEDQLQQHERRTNVKSLTAATVGKLRRFWEFYIGVPLTLVLAYFPSRKRQRSAFALSLPNMGLAFWTLFVVLILDNLCFFAYFPHYSAAVTVLIVLVLIQCLRIMRASGSAGRFLSRTLPLLCLWGLLLPLCGRWLEGFLPPKYSHVAELWHSEFLHEVSREQFTAQLERLPGQQLVLVHYQPYDGSRKHEWIFNRADLRSAKIVWARDSDNPQTVRRLQQEFPGRRMWRAEPDSTPPRLIPYPDESHVQTGGVRMQ